MGSNYHQATFLSLYYPRPLSTPCSPLQVCFNTSQGQYYSNDLESWKSHFMFNSSELDLFFAHISASIAMHLTGMPFFAAILRGCQSCNTFIHSIHKKVCKFITGAFSAMPTVSLEDPWISLHTDSILAHEWHLLSVMLPKISRD